jgi:hypothetical protein
VSGREDSAFLTGDKAQYKVICTPLPPSLSSSFLVVRLVRNYCFERQFLSRDIEGSNPILEGVVHLISIEHGESVICTLEVPSLSNRRFILDGLTAD